MKQRTMKRQLTPQNIVRNRVSRLRMKIHDFHIKKTTIALLLMLPYLASEWSARAFNLYVVFPPIDNFIHASFGIAFAAVAYLIYNKNKTFVLAWSFVVSVFWEILEITGDKYVPQTAVLMDPFFYDGIKDITVAFLGTVITLYLIRRVIKRHYFKIEGMK